MEEKNQSKHLGEKLNTYFVNIMNWYSDTVIPLHFSHFLDINRHSEEFSVTPRCIYLLDVKFVGQLYGY